MKAYSLDLRKRVLATYDSGKFSLNHIAEQFQVTTRWIQKLRRQREQEGSIAPKPQNQGRKPAFQGKHLEQLNTFVQTHPDATLEDIQEHFSRRVPCSIVTIHNTLKRLGWRYKKNRYEPVSKTGKMSDLSAGYGKKPKHS
jgi:transposase